ncbi:GrpB family protein [bacterium]|nr:GrpB family protein [bacterium]
MNKTPQGEATIELVQYDHLWPSKFEMERAVLQTVLVPWLVGTIEHVGSTAIPGMPAKPVIDIMAAVGSLDASRPAISALAETDYTYFPYRADIMHWFCKPSAAFRTHHLHLVPLDSQRWIDCLAFRDAIRNDQALAVEYASLKRRLAQEFKFDREAYTDGKTPFVERVLSSKHKSQI